MVEQLKMKPAVMEIPENMSLREQDSSLEFEYRWYKPKYIAFLIAGPFCAYFLIKSKYIAGDFQQLTIPALVLIFCALYIFYYSLARVLNTTFIHVTKEKISVRHGPLPFKRNLELKKDDVTQLYVARQKGVNKYYLLVVTYQVNVILKNGSVITLVKGLDMLQQARFIENKIEDYLNITDVAVEGEEPKE